MKSRDKFNHLNKLLFDEFAMIHVNTSVQGLVIPNHLLSEPSVALKLSKMFMGKLVVEKDQITAELRFSGEYFTCQVPWNSVWAISSFKGETAIWPDEIPEQMVPAILPQLASLRLETSTTDKSELAPQPKADPITGPVLTNPTSPNPKQSARNKGGLKLAGRRHLKMATNSEGVSEKKAADESRAKDHNHNESPEGNPNQPPKNSPKARPQLKRIK